MEFTIRQPDITVAELCQKIDYEPQLEKGCGNYIKPIGQDNYPRFHLLIEEGEEELKLKLHFDQKQGNNHDCEYESERVIKEANGIKEIIFKEVFNSK